MRWLVFLLLCWPLTVWADLQSEDQYAALKNDILVTNQAEFAADVAAGNHQKIADAYNLNKAPAFFVWRTALARRDIYEGKVVDVPPTQTTWNWATFQSQSVQQRDSWEEMLRDGVINPSLDNVRANYNTIFGGTGASAQQQQFLLAISRRKALRIKALLAVTTDGNGAASTPATLTYIGGIDLRDVAHALNGVPLQ